MNRPIRQVAYFCADVRKAALAHHAAFGSGPYFVADNIPLRSALHRGVERPLDHTSAYGQWGEVMIEFVQQNNPGPSAFHDLYPEGSGRWGLHHVALFVDDVDAECARLGALGFATALRAEMSDGFVFAFADTVSAYGHMTELYAPAPVLTGFYDMVAQAAKAYAGGDVITTISFS
ncbi:VOC family protein [Novosphingobium lentum]|uniref:VOC family protein n=1 Tax=Novosphingobium lentum TaxID=145287 RepID=UPI000836C0AB|nr:VOC family protein [Novosphingobium lentum]